ncbi:MAG: hypothetical protein Q4G49_04295 [Paracoccus sp. (in: a-proteobacteria)]|nr:hypothetical protein [Paracoccus sp. (in: a-proteobacteria)]
MSTVLGGHHLEENWRDILFLWGGAAAIIFVGLQAWVIKAAGPDALPASAIYVAIFNVAIGLGAAVGSSLLSMFGLTTLFLCAGVMAVLAFLSLSAVTQPRTNHTEPA